MNSSFITWSQHKAYRLLSLARNEGVPVLRAEIPKFLYEGGEFLAKGVKPCPYKSFVELDCDKSTWDRLITEMYATVKEEE